MWKLKLKNIIPFTITQKFKYLHKNLTKYMHDLYAENYTMVMKEIKEVSNKWRDMLCSWIGRLNIVKEQILLKFIQI